MFYRKVFFLSIKKVYRWKDTLALHGVFDEFGRVFDFRIFDDIEAVCFDGLHAYAFIHCFLKPEKVIQSYPAKAIRTKMPEKLMRLYVH